MMVVTEHGLVCVDEYLMRDQAFAIHHTNIVAAFRLNRFAPMNIRWTANKNERQLGIEFGMKGIGIIKAENKQLFGIQRVQSWLVTKQMWFAPTVPRTKEQMKAYRYANNFSTDGQKKVNEDVFKLNDELPDCIRYGVMGYPTLPDEKIAVMTDADKHRWNTLDERSRVEIERMREFNMRQQNNDLSTEEEGYPYGTGYHSSGW